MHLGCIHHCLEASSALGTRGSRRTVNVPLTAVRDKTRQRERTAWCCVSGGIRCRFSDDVSDSCFPPVTCCIGATSQLPRAVRSSNYRMKDCFLQADFLAAHLALSRPLRTVPAQAGVRWAQRLTYADPTAGDTRHNTFGHMYACCPSVWLIISQGRHTQLIFLWQHTAKSFRRILCTARRATGSALLRALL